MSCLTSSLKKRTRSKLWQLVVWYAGDGLNPPAANCSTSYPSDGRTTLTISWHLSKPIPTSRRISKPFTLKAWMRSRVPDPTTLAPTLILVPWRPSRTLFPNVRCWSSHACRSSILRGLTAIRPRLKRRSRSRLNIWSLLFNTEFLQVDMTGNYHWPEEETVPASTFRGLTRPLQHPRICWRGIGKGPAPFLFLRDNLECLTEMLLHFSNTITALTISFGHIGMYNEYSRGITREDLVPLSLSSLKHLSLLRFDLDEPLLSNDPEKSLCWTDSAGIPTLLSFFPHDLPLTGGIHIDVMVEQDLLPGVPIYMHNRSEVEDALLQFNNLSDVTLVLRNSYDGEECARAADGIYLRAVWPSWFTHLNQKERVSWSMV
ncbi:hypothetical protein C8Q74DRAFT_17904 [Fomes fomentarius]|nr:hypothetical protein C8Q74DRAFT_17904 [Fomes fomentarius]